MLLANSDISPDFAWQLALCLAGAAHFAVKMLQGFATWKEMRRAQYAEKQETDDKYAELLRKLEDFRAETNKQHAAAVDSGNNRIASLKDEMHKMFNDLSSRFMDKIDDELREVFQRVNTQGERIARVEQATKSKS